ncbi:MAG: conjugal transfer protein TraF [Gammaproteobacteria bacterium]|nr:conjugal transfer protein TraF [Gammaproteobacteria bacterium]
MRHIVLLYHKTIMAFFISFILFITIYQNAYANVVSDSINTLIQNRNVNGSSLSANNTQNLKEKYHTFDAVNRTFAFVIFYRSTCPHCQHFVPVLSQFANDYGFRVYPYATDDQALSSFPNSMPMTTQIERTFFTTPSIEVPSLFLINVKTMKAYLIDQGEMSYTDLENRVKLFFQIAQSQMMVNQ